MTRQIPEYVYTSANSLGVEPRALAAVVQVESGGRVTVRVDGQDLPRIRYEHHVAYRVADTRGVLSGFLEAGLAVRDWTPSLAARTDAGAWDLYEQASMIDDETAAQACSWGVGQVLGENAKWIGYRSGVAMANRACSGVEGQVEVMARFIQKKGLVKALNDHDWVKFAYDYNGPQHAKHDYAGKLARAYDAFDNVTGLPETSDPEPKPALPWWLRLWNWIKNNAKEPEL